MKSFLFAFLFTLFSSHYSLASEDTNAFKALMIKKYMEGAFHGLILYSDSEGVTHQLALGLANPETGESLNTQHKFAINSMGKMFTSILIMQLVEEGKIQLDDTLAKHLPQHAHPKAPNITIHHLLSHRSGIPDALINQIRGVLPWDLTIEEQLEAVYELPLDFEPGTGFHYCNLGFYLLGKIVKKFRNGTFEEILTKQIFEPLKMSDSSTTDNTNMTAYFKGDGTVQFYSKEVKSEGDGHGIATLVDMHKFLSAVDSDTLLTKKSWELMFTPHSLPSEVPEGAWPPPHQDPYGYGFGLMPIEVDGEKYTVVGHGGAGYGSNYAGRILGTKKVIVVHNNMMKNPILPDVIEFVARQ